MKISIINGWSDLNRGTSAIILGLIKELKNNYKIEKINIMSEMHYKDDIDSYNNNIKDIEKDHDVEQFTSLFNGFNKVNPLKVLISIIKSRLLLINYKLFMHLYDSESKKTIMELVNSDIVISKGGHIFYNEKNTLKNKLYFYKLSYLLLFCKRYKIKYMLLAQSYGPFNNKYAQNTMRKLVENSEKTTYRESRSYVELLKIKNINKDKLSLMYDTAFYIDKKEVTSNLFNNDKIKVGITLRNIHFRLDEKENYLNTIKNLINKYIESDYMVYIIPHVTGPNEIEDDTIISSELYLNYVDNENVVYINNDYSAREMLCIYEKFNLLVGTRFNSVIFSLSCDVPIISISYAGFKSYITEQFDLKDYMYNIRELNEISYLDIFNKSKALINNKEVIENIKQKKEDIISSLDEQFMTII